MNQRDRGGRLLQDIDAKLQAASADVQSLRDLLDAAQNGPPHGEADGTLNDRRYNLLRDALNCASNAVKIVRSLVEDY